MDVAKHINDLIPLAAQMASNVCDAAKHHNVQDTVSNAQRSQLTVEMLRILLQEEKMQGGGQTS